MFDGPCKCCNFQPIHPLDLKCISGFHDDNSYFQANDGAKYKKYSHGVSDDRTRIKTPNYFVQAEISLKNFYCVKNKSFIVNLSNEMIACNIECI